MTGNELLRPGERIDDLKRGGYRLIQDPEQFCFGVDAVLLAWFLKVKPGEKALDFCTGTGAVMMLADARYPGGTWTGLEIRKDMAEMAGRSVLLNGTGDHMEAVEGDLKEASKRFGKARFDVISVNPPYKRAGSGLKNPLEAKAVARHEILCTLDDVLKEAAILLKDGGRFYMVHRPERVAEILSKMRENRLAPKDLVFVHPFEEKDATMVLVSGIRNGKNDVKVGAPIVLYRAPGVYTERYLRIYSE